LHVITVNKKSKRLKNSLAFRLNPEASFKNRPVQATCDIF
jgi:hypothetical protein